MKNNLLAIVLLLSFPLFSQWAKISSTTSKNLNSVFYFSNTLAVAVGDTGTILLSTNAAASFANISSGTTKNLKSVFFLNSTKGFIVGEGGTILTTSNGGNSWLPITSPTTNELTNINFFDSNNGIIVGNNGTILKTNNGGSSWTNIPPITIYYLNKVLYFTSSYAIALGANGTVLKTYNGGNSWTIKNISTTKFITDAATYSTNKAKIIGDKGWVLSVDTAIVESKKDSLCFEKLNGIYCYDTYCIAVGKNGKIKFTEDGSKWDSLVTIEKTHLNDIHFYDNNNGLIVGEKGLIFRTTSGGIFGNSITEISAKKSSIYPNPSSSSFTVELNSDNANTSIQIFNALGQISYQSTFSNTNKIFFHQNFVPGLYLIVFDDGVSSWTEKLLIR